MEAREVGEDNTSRSWIWRMKLLTSKEDRNVVKIAERKKKLLLKWL